MVDAEVIARRLREIDRRLQLLERLRAAHDVRQYHADIALRAQVERHLQIAIQSAIDAALHVVAEDTARTPADYGGAFELLAEEGLLDVALAGRLRNAAGLRNVLVHGYADVDDAIVWSSLERLDDLRSFAAAMVAHIAQTD